MRRTELLVMKDDIRTAKVVDAEDVPVEEGQIRVRIDKFALTANTITYAVYGHSFGYWGFFPADEIWGKVPTWGFGSVVESRSDSVAVGERYYGFYPMSSHVVMQVSETSLGFKDAMPHRDKLPKAYNHYASTTKDPVFDPDHEDAQMILRPLFVTSFLAQDFLSESQFFGAETVLITSASSKTGYGLAFLIAERSPGIRLVGLTSERNRGFTESLGCYQSVRTYDELSALQQQPSLVVDISGSPKVRMGVAQRLGDDLRYSMALGDTHWQEDKQELDPSSAEFFFAPKWLAKRAEDWTMAGYVQRLADAWKGLADPLSAAIQIRRASGPDALLGAYLAHADGRADPKIGDVISLN